MLLLLLLLADCREHRPRDDARPERHGCWLMGMLRRARSRGLRVV
jgi:hypothetical protein